MFCSVQCAARVNPVQHEPAHCATCGTPIRRGRTVCHAHRNDPLIDRTLAELKSQYSTNQYHAKIRGLARDAYTGPMACRACGYSLHVEICHMRPVSDFPMTATLREVNDPANLVAFDKRCHWEYDHGYIVI